MMTHPRQVEPPDFLDDDEVLGGSADLGTLPRPSGEFGAEEFGAGEFGGSDER